MTIEASAPSNIALIKYMGKSSGNLPTNASLSYTLEHLRSFVTLTPAKADEWAPLTGYPELQLSDKGQRKFLDHFTWLKQHWNIPGHYLVRSANNFPADCGLASSASSFAALTRVTYLLAREVAGLGELHTEELSRLSRRGSGSSCRSWFTPWAMWRGEGAEPVDLNLQLAHAVVIVHAGRKAVSSSEAHVRVSESLLFQGRTARAEARLARLLQAMRLGSWQECFELSWAEFWDMHALFETSQPAFGYMTPESLAVLERLRTVWRETGDGPLVTMDAGANVHLLLRPEQRATADRWLQGLNTIRSWS